MMRDRRTAPFPLLPLGMSALLLLSLAANAGQGGDRGPYTLRMKFKQGEVTRYQIAMQISLVAPNQPNTPMFPGTTSVLEEKVTKTLANGGAEVTITPTGQQTGMAGKPVSPVTLTYDPTGRVVATKGVPTPTTNAVFMGDTSVEGFTRTTPILPTKAIKVGDTWTQQIVLPAPVNTTATMKCSFIKVETVGQVKTAHLRGVVTTPISLMMNAAMQPTKKAAEATATMSGNSYMTSDVNYALTDGKMIHLASIDDFAMTIKQKQPNSPPSGSGTISKPGSAAAPASTKINAKVTLDLKLIP